MDNLVSRDLAVLLKEKNFELFKGREESNSRLNTVQDWFREKHEIFVTALPFRDNEDNIELCWYYSLVENNEELDDILCNEDHLGASHQNYESYYKALEEGLKEACKYI